jgi:hypothetical protein
LLPTVRWVLPGSVLTLAVWVAGVILFSAAAFFLVIEKSTGTQLSDQIDRRHW